MKKLLTLLLIIACMLSLAACGKNNEPDTPAPDAGQTVDDAVITKIVSMFPASQPTRTVVGTKQTAGDTVLEGVYTLIVGTSNGKSAATYYKEQDKLISVEDSGKLDYVTGTVIKETVNKEYLEGYGVRVDGGEWNSSEPSFVTTSGIIALNLKSELISKAQYDEATKTLVCTIAADKTAEVLGEAISAEVTVTIVHDGARINSIVITYTIPASGQNEAMSLEIKAFYSYDLEILNIDAGVEE